MTLCQDPFAGFGLGLRPQHFPDILAPDRDAGLDRVDWFEIISENFMAVGGMPLRNLMAVRERRPMAMHGVSLSIGAPDPLDDGYLKDLKMLADLIAPAVVSDHLCWTGAHGVNLHDLLPLPLTEETLDHVAARVARVQDVLGRRIALENASTYVTFTADTMNEWDFLAELTRRADCDLLLDVNNVYVSAFNHGFDPADYLAGIPKDRVCQIHLAGHEHNGDHIVDTHDAPVMIERDADIPPFADLVAELGTARRLAGDALDEAAA